MKIDFLPVESIEGSALRLLAAYRRAYPEAVMLPVPVEEVAECYLELDFEDLQGTLEMPDVLGAVWFEERKMWIDQSLDPSVFPRQQGRYRFTVAHEVGHWELHRKFFLGRAEQESLFGSGAEPSLVCRSGEKKKPAEWQADAFSAFLLMPQDEVFRV